MPADDKSPLYVTLYNMGSDHNRVVTAMLDNNIGILKPQAT